MNLGNRSFYFTISIVGILIVCTILVLRVYNNMERDIHELEIVRITSIDSSLEIHPNTQDNGAIHNDIKYNSSIKYFTFDPNEASYDDFILLGLKPNVARQIINYRNTGARFRKPDDFSKIYALSEHDFERLRPYIKINATSKGHSNYVTKSDSIKPQHKTYIPKTNHPIDVNNADKETWMKQKGIGEGFANRIISYREKLGGFVEKEQLKEVYGLPDSTYQNIFPFLNIDKEVVTKINVNLATFEELSQHPYIGKKIAENIVKLRNDLGKYNKIEDLRMLPLINEEKYRKIAKYLIAQ